MTAEGEQSAETPATPMMKVSTTGSQGLLMIGAALIVAGWILFGLLIGQYAVPSIFVALAALVLLSILGMGGVGVGTGTQRAIGLFIGIAALIEILNDLRFTSFPDGFVDVLAYLVFVVGAALMFWGARGTKAS
jgi:hypothetical protein